MTRSRPGRANLESVAAAAGVSRATVSRVVNGWASVAPELRERVERAIAELGYVPNQAARSLVTQRADAVALVVAEPDPRVFGDPYFSGIVRGVSTELLSAGVQVVLLMAQSDEELSGIERYLRTAPLDGVLLVSEHSSNDPIPAAMIEAGMPLVIGGRPMQPGLDVPSVDNDNVGGARVATEHLVARGCRRVGTVAGPIDMAAGVDRLEGVRLALGGDLPADRVEHGAFTQASGEEATRRLLDRVPDLDGLFVASDLMALGALRALRLAGRRVPDDVAVVGFDDIPLASATEPPLTTARQQTVLQGRTMARMLLARARPDLRLREAPEVPDVTPDRVVLPVELVVRDSA
ncbi:LacI family transcriptional regulator [Actinotalea ferrariae CF5-4]|uniref:LacI family transcriptional regulator n=1 Tax=Actinotalea ferrariae CF5-4 TaxID=948458 RepID=A0A021VTX8_9CELL|nr:LacI family DNA-binding transcriptional regulator [Actinotalea ferrariae]EYR62522.1 LacI family transcriptional regulator [Actinotalea ferrariae CF5-4]